MSVPVYHRKGSTLRDAIIYQNGDGTFNTGRVQGDFTLKLSKDGTGNQSTSGVTITEVSAANNPGEYEVEVASSAFVAANGTYVLVITRTSDPSFTWEQVYIVNDTGTSTSTPASFTATASDGRVMSSGSPVSGATVYLTLSGTFITQTTTDASGLWGPVYLGDGTYTVRVQKSGYEQATATITVSGGSVTGPGSDINLTLGAVANPLSAGQLWAYARRMAVDLTGSKADTIIKGAVNDALDMVSSEQSWPWLLRSSTLDLRGYYSTGTITITNGSANIVLSGGTWPSWAASGKIQVSGQVIDIATRTDGTTLTMADAWVPATITAASYILYQNEYDLPDDLWSFHLPLPGQRWGWGGEPRPPADILLAENAAVYGQQFPGVHAIANGQFQCWPYPTQDVRLRYTYYARPARLAVDTDIADWEPTHVEVLKRAIDYQLARQLGRVTSGDAATTLQAYREALGRILVKNREPVSIPAVGMHVDFSSRDLDWKRRT